MQFSKLILGTVQFGLPYGIANRSGKPDYQTILNILSYAAEHAVTAVDTAPSYGDSEQLLGRALSDLGLQQQLQVISKIPKLPADIAAVGSYLERSVRQSLQRLGLEVLPVLLLHHEHDLRHLAELKKLVAQGLVLQVGVSLDSVWDWQAAGIMDCDCIQVPANLLDHRFDALVASFAGPVFLRSVYLQGLLLMPESEFSSNLAALLPYRRRLESFALPLRELCWRYLLSLPGECSILSGVEKLSQLQENLALAAAGPLAPDLFASISRAVPLLEEKLLRPSCWQK